MNLCDDGHEEVCYDGRNCPACSVTTDKNAEIDGLEKQINDLKSEVSELSTQLSDSHNP